MEATGLYHVNLAVFLFEKGNEVHVCNPLQIKRFCQMELRRSKTDRADARMITEFSNVNAAMLELWRPMEDCFAQARAIMTEVALLMKHAQAKSNSIQSLRSTPAGRGAALLVANHLRAERLLIVTLLKQAVALVQVSYPAEMHNATSIPGIGDKTAAVVLIATGALSHFDNSRQLSAYLGMCPRQFQSGTSVHGKGHICKMGNPHVRALLHMCALSSLKWNPPCRAFYDSLVGRSVHPMVALGAVANKLLRTMFAVVKAKTAWNIEVAMAK